MTAIILLLVVVLTPAALIYGAVAMARSERGA